MQEATTQETITREAIVKWYSVAKGYGFLEPTGEADGQSGSQEHDIFVHHSLVDEETDGPLLTGERVQVDAVKGQRGWHAKSLVRLGESS